LARLTPPEEQSGSGASVSARRRRHKCQERLNSKSALRWYWSLTVLGAGHAGIPKSGRAPTLEEAKTELQANFKKWLVWAKLEET
jgi:hypothetical protein